MTDQRNYPVPPPPTPAEAREVLVDALRYISAAARGDGDALRRPLERHGVRLAQALGSLALDFAQVAYGDSFIDRLAELAEVVELNAMEKRVLAEVEELGER